MALVEAATYLEKESQNRVVQDEIAQWNVEKEANRLKKIQEQKEIREMLDKYWPWSNGFPKPRGLRNLRLEGIFPNKDLKARQLEDTLELVRPRQGVLHPERKIFRRKEDPLLRYQYNKDLRNVVDNSLRYKTNRKEKKEYRKQLDAQIAEKRQKEEMEMRNDIILDQRSLMKSPPWGKPGPGGTAWRPPRSIGLHFLKSLGWSTEDTLQRLNEEPQNYLESIRKDYQSFKRMCSQPPKPINMKDIRISPIKENQDPSKIPESNNAKIPSAAGRRKLSPLIKNNVNGEELVSLLAKQRAVPMKVPLNTTDVTRDNPDGKKARNPKYLHELTNQMDLRKNLLKELRAKEIEMVRHHFATLDGFWGRPGHGAPLPMVKKCRLDQLLYSC